MCKRLLCSHFYDFWFLTVFWQFGKLQPFAFFGYDEHITYYCNLIRNFKELLTLKKFYIERLNKSQ